MSRYCIPPLNYSKRKKVFSFPFKVIQVVSINWWPLLTILRMLKACWEVVDNRIVVFSQNNIIIILYEKKRYLCCCSYDWNWNDFKLVKFILKRYGYHYIISWIWYITISLSFQCNFNNVDMYVEGMTSNCGRLYHHF